WIAALRGRILPGARHLVHRLVQHGPGAVGRIASGGPLSRLDRAQQTQSGVNTLGQRIAALIAAQGPVSIAEFMTMALHDPQGGYYATRDPFGAAGDFITAPEISQMFGEFLG